MKFDRTYFSLLITKKKSKQVTSLYASMVMGIAVGIGVSVFNTRVLGKEQYGDLKFLQNLFLFIVTFLTLGLFVSGARIIAQKKYDDVKKKIIGIIILLGAVVSIIMIICLFIFSFFEEKIFDNNLGNIIRIISPLLFVFPFQQCLNQILTGDNKIYSLSIYRIAPKVLYLLTAVSFNLVFKLTLLNSLIIQLVSFGIVIIFLLIKIHPEFKEIKKSYKIIWQENKTYGLHIYIGLLFGVATSRLGGIAIGYYLNNTSVGYFSLANTITMPLMLIPNVVGTTFYKDFANRNSISKKATTVTIILSISVLIFFLLIVKKIILLLYSSEYSAVVSLAYLVSIGCIFHGFGDYINRFIGAHGIGKYNRNAAICVGISNIVGYIILIKLFGVKGAVITKVFSGIIYFGMMVYYYKKLIHDIELNMIKK